MGKGGSKNEVKETSAERANASVALKRYRRYLNVYRPLEAAAFGDVTGDSSARHIERVASGRINADSAQLLENNRLPAGLDPSRGTAFKAIHNPTRAAIVADAASDAAGLGRKQKIAGLQAGANIGSGQLDDVQLSFGALAGQELERSINKQVTSFNRRNALIEGGMSLAGAALSAGTHSPATTTPEPYAGPLSPTDEYNYTGPLSPNYIY